MCTEYSVKMNIKKKNYMTITKQQNVPENITLQGKQLEQVTKSKYLRTCITQNN